MKKISLIVPVYNGEKYLTEMAQSALAQSWGNLEIIFSNDGSQDGSLSILEALAAQDPRIKVVTGENRGVSAARNRALAQATGDYIGFADSDDLLEPGYLKALAELLETYQADVACCGFTRIYAASGKQDRMPPKTGPVQVADREEFRKNLLRPDGYTTVMWNKLFRRQVLLDDTGSFYRFDETLHIVEDGEFTFRLPVKRAVFTSQSYYRYFVRTSGAMYGSFNARKATELQARKKIVDLCRDDSQELQDLAKMKYQKGVRDLLFHAVLSGQGNDTRSLWSELKIFRRELYTSPYLSKKEKLKYGIYAPLIFFNMKGLGGFLMKKLSGH